MHIRLKTQTIKVCVCLGHSLHLLSIHVLSTRHYLNPFSHPKAFLRHNTISCQRVNPWNIWLFFSCNLSLRCYGYCFHGFQMKHFFSSIQLIPLNSPFHLPTRRSPIREMILHLSVQSEAATELNLWWGDGTKHF